MTTAFNKDYTSFRLGVLLILPVMSALAVMSSCTTDEGPEYFIEAPLQEYFDRFAYEGSLRQVEIDFTKLKVSGDIRVIVASQVIGQCSHTDKEPNTVIIDKIYWDSANDLEREFLVFHELGHCALGRGHLDQADAQGKCISIMTSGTGSCQISYTPANRKTLLDELFAP